MKTSQTVEALRGLAALAVALFHFTNGSPLLPEWQQLRQFGSHGWLGVEVFFVISGFVIALSMSRRNYRLGRDGPRFVAKRLVRLEPPYIIAVLLCIVLWYGSSATSQYQGEPPDVSLRQVALHLGYLVALYDEAWLNPVFWTLALEFQFYLSVCLIYPLLASPHKLVRTTAMITILLIPLLCEDNRLVTFWFGLFGCGLLVWMRSKHSMDRVSLLVLVAVCAVSNFLTHGLTITLVTLVAMAALLFVELRRYVVLAFLGAVSYSFYLLHVPVGGRVINLMGRLEPSLARDLLAVTAALASSLLAAWAMYVLVERPSKNWSARIRYGNGDRRVE